MTRSHRTKEGTPPVTSELYTTVPGEGPRHRRNISVNTHLGDGTMPHLHSRADSPIQAVELVRGLSIQADIAEVWDRVAAAAAECARRLRAREEQMQRDTAAAVDRLAAHVDADSIAGVRDALAAGLPDRAAAAITALAGAVDTWLVAPRRPIQAGQVRADAETVTAALRRVQGWSAA